LSAAGRKLGGREGRLLEIIDTARAKPARFRDERITMAHGAGGKASEGLLEGLILPALGSDGVEHSDAAELTLGDARLAITADSFVVSPLRFPGGSIGQLAVNGTVNDLAVSGARPVAISLSLILEEGLAAAELEREIEVIAAAAEAAGVKVATGDTKVVERAHADGIYACTTGIGSVDPRAELSPGSIQPGDRILVSGSIGEHGTAIMLARGEFELAAEIESDTRSLWPVAEALIGAAAGRLRCMRDATRGGVASVLNELAQASGVSMTVDEAEIPVRPPVAAAAELLGIDPLHIANEGQLVAFVDPDVADRALDAMRSIPGCEPAAEIGVVSDEPGSTVLMQTQFGGRRVLDRLVGDPLPRIC
jgi:hydrogenase expression/formation protein HypE